MKVCASVFGGPNDPSTGHVGYKGDDLRGHYAFAELGMGTLLGGLPYKAHIKVKHKGPHGTADVILEKLDIGAGGAGCGGYPRAIDVWYEAAQGLGLSGLDVVDIEILTPAQTEKARSALEKKNNEENSFLGRHGSVPGQIGSGIEHAGAGLLDWTKGLTKLLEFITSSSGWVRIAKVTGGLVLILIAVNQLSKISGGPQIPTPPIGPVGTGKSIANVKPNYKG